MKTGILAAVALALAACSGQVVTQSPTSNTSASISGIGYCVSNCPPGVVGCRTIRCSQYTNQMAFTDAAHLSAEEQKVEAQMEAQLKAEVGAQIDAEEEAKQASHR